MEISAKQVMELRQSTGMPMMKCKQALKSADGDFEKAVEILRKEGLKTADKKAGRKTSEGLIGTHITSDGKAGSMVQVLCESEPVKNTPMFREFVERLVAHSDRNNPGSVDELLAQSWDGDEGATVEEALRHLIAKIGENIRIGGVARFTVDGDGIVGSYVHNDHKQGAIVALSGSGDSVRDTAKELCQHIVFAKPAVLSRDEVPADEVEKELAFLKAQVSEDPKMQGKPEQAIDGIVKGRLDKNFFGERVLSEQGWYREPAKKVSAVLDERGVDVQAFAHFAPDA